MTEIDPGHGMTRLRHLQATMAKSLFTLDVALVAMFWPVALRLARFDVATADIC
jgi:hypothetical protein